MPLFRAPKKQPDSPADFIPEALPQHVAIIMDGNGRWGKQHHRPRAFGHRAGVEALRAVIRESSDLGIKALSLYAFSTENWRRPSDEVGVLMGLLLEYFQKEIEELHANRVRIHILGDVEGMPEPQRTALKEAMRQTQDNTGLKLNIAINYGGRSEIVSAARGLALKAAQGELDPMAIDEALFEAHLYTKGLPEIDLLIRTSGEIRLSNFLLYQLAYAEFVFVDTLWPDFDIKAYHEALRTYQGRKRRFGGLS